MASHYGPVFLVENFVTLECDPSGWDHVAHGEISYTVYWEGIPRQSRLLVRVPSNLASYFLTGPGGFSRIAEE